MQVCWLSTGLISRLQKPLSLLSKLGVKLQTCENLAYAVRAAVRLMVKIEKYFVNP